MKTRNERDRFLEALSETSNILHASKKTGISRSTIHRWIKDNVDFRKKVEDALKMGNDNLCDLGEGTLVKKMKEGDMQAIKYFLQNNHPKYIAKRSIYVSPPLLTHKHLKHGEVCEFCQQRRAMPLSFGQFEAFNIQMTKDVDPYQQIPVTEADYDQYLKEHFPDYKKPY